MRLLRKSLQDHELIVLRIIGEWWEIDLTGLDKKKCVAMLAAEMPNLDIPQEIVYLPAEEVDAIKALVRKKGRMPKATFTREFGDIRQMGPGALEREEPWLDPQSAAEDLWYRGLIFSGIDRDDPSVEHIYLPTEFLNMFDLATLDQEGEGGEGGDTDDPIEAVEGPEDNDFEDVPAPDALQKKKTSLKGIGRSIPDSVLQGGTGDEIAAALKKQLTEKPKPAPKPAKKKPIQIKKPPKKATAEVEADGEGADAEYVEIDEAPPEYDDGTVTTEEESGVPRKSIEERPMEPEPEWATRTLPPETAVVEAGSKPEPKAKQGSRLGKKAGQITGGRSDKWTPAATDAVDDFVTLLTLAQTDLLQDGRTGYVKPYLLNRDENRLNMLIAIGLSLAYLRRVDGGYRPTKAAVAWLQKGREAQLSELATGWLTCGWNELRHVPTLSCEGSNWSNDPQAARKALLDGLTLIDERRTYGEVVQQIKKENPDFQRPNGNYDLWYIRDLAAGEYVAGFENWELVEGRLLRYLIEKPLNWLGMSDVGHEQFRLTERAIGWINEDEPAESEQPDPLTLSDDGLLLLPASVDRYKRFQAGRFAQLQPATVGEPFSYRVTPGSLQRAEDVGIGSDRVLQFLQQASADGSVPAGLKRAIQRWSENGVEGRIEQMVVLQVLEPKTMEILRNRPETKPFLSESLSDTAVLVMADQWGELCQAAAGLGLLLEPPEFK